ncbi:metallophosphoesterase [Methanosphaera sp. WGK6]|uniref:metallophosphoesterase family protein n=1 Tax=Methanosphaera sp. WGK6 TaxID=1561964 RepID=UPI00084CB360|nr:metallophosphoesterase [Methanosphaera sp. WGK6]OED30156.1 phosphohydrolase [Methanosphaera sp. WGK6]
MTKLVHISDLHTGYSHFRKDILLKTIKEINEMKPAAVIITGDLTDNGFYNEFIQAKKYIDMIKPKKIIVPGNHDARNIGYEIFEELFGESHSVLELKNEAIKIIGLDSSEPDIGHGKIGRIQRRFMEKELADANERGLFTIIALHHHIIPIPHTGRERNILSDAGDILLTVLQNNVNIVLSGHKHVPHIWKMNNTLFTTAGTVSSMKLRGNIPPSYNVIDINNPHIEITLHNSDETIKHLTPP